MKIKKMKVPSYNHRDFYKCSTGGYENTLSFLSPNLTHMLPEKEGKGPVAPFEQTFLNVLVLRGSAGKLVTRSFATYLEMIYRKYSQKYISQFKIP